MDEKLSLIDRLANLLGCEYVNHLYHLRLLDRQQKSRLLDELEKIPAEVVSLIWVEQCFGIPCGRSQRIQRRTRKRKAAGSIDTDDLWN